LSLLDTIKSLLPELSQAGSCEAAFGRPIDAEGVLLVPVARLGVGFLGLGGSSDKVLAGGAYLEPVAVIVVRDTEVSLLHFDRGRRPPAADECGAAPTLEGWGPAGGGAGGGRQPGAGAGHGHPAKQGQDDVDSCEGFSLGAVGDALQTLITEVGKGARAARRGARDKEPAAQTPPGSAPGPGGDGGPVPPPGRTFGVAEEEEEEARPDDVADRGHGEGRGEA